MKNIIAHARMRTPAEELEYACFQPGFSRSPLFSTYSNFSESLIIFQLTKKAPEGKNVGGNYFLTSALQFLTLLWLQGSCEYSVGTTVLCIVFAIKKKGGGAA